MKKLDFVNTPFDAKLELSRKNIRVRIRDAAIYVNDTMELVYASAKQVFGKNVSPEIVLEMYDRVLEKIESGDAADDLHEDPIEDGSLDKAE